MSPKTEKLPENHELAINYDPSLETLPYSVEINSDLLQNYLRSEGFNDRDISDLNVEVRTGMGLKWLSGQYHPLKNRILLNPGSLKISHSPDKPQALTTTLLHEIAHAKEHLAEGEDKKLETQTILYHFLGVGAVIAASGLFTKELIKHQSHRASTATLATGLGLGQLAYRMAPYEKRARDYAERRLREHPELMQLVTVNNK